MGNEITKINTNINSSQLTRLDSLTGYESHSAQHTENLLNKVQNPYELEEYINRNGNNGTIEMTGMGGETLQVKVVTENNKKRIEVLDLTTSAPTEEQIKYIQEKYSTPLAHVNVNMVPVLTDITSANDYQSLSLMNCKGFYELEGITNISPVGKSINEMLLHLYVEGGSSIEQSNAFIYLSRMSQAGLGELRVVEIVEDTTSMDAIVLQDPEGNYVIHYDHTRTDSYHDVLHDIGTILNANPSYVGENFDKYIDPFLGVVGIAGSIMNYGPATFFSDIFSSLSDASGLGFKTPQYTPAAKLALRYAEKAKISGKKIVMDGYSLGGSLVEFSASSLVANGYEPWIDNVISINPLHPYLTMEYAQRLYKLNDDGKFNLYANIQDGIHRINYEKEFSPITKYINLSVSEEMTEKIEDDKNASGSFMDSVMKLFWLDSRHSDDAIIVDATLVNTYFDENGNFRPQWN